MSIRQEIFRYLDEKYEDDRSLKINRKLLYSNFSAISKNSVDTYANQWRKIMKQKLSHVPKTAKKSAQPPAQRPQKQDIPEHITREIVEQWIIHADERAPLGLKFIGDEKKYVEEINQDEVDLEEEEFKELMQLPSFLNDPPDPEGEDPEEC